MDKQLVSECLVFIENYWNKIILSPKESHDNLHIIPLPHTFITPNYSKTSQWKGAMFYWDSFFILKGFVNTKRDWIIFSMIDNFIYLFNKYGIIPNANFWGFLGSSQPPFLTSIIFDGYYSLERSNNIKNAIKKLFAKTWLKKRIETAKKEYFNVWENEKEYNHKLFKFNLNKYGDRDVGYNLNAERESGWDFTTRFYNRCNDFLAIDLNSFLFKYESDFLRASQILNDKKEQDFWTNKMKERQLNVEKYMWNAKKGFFFDYDYKNNIQSEFYSLAGFTPLWVKLATYEQALEMVKKLPLFETENGLTVTSKISQAPQVKLDKDLSKEYKITIDDILKPKQWDYPNIWAPIEYLTVIGLLRYGFINDALRIMKKSINANLKIFKKYGMLLEKMNGLTGDIPNEKYWYEAQLGFGWTNAVFYRYVKIIEYIEKENGNIYNNEEKIHKPPFDITTLIH